MARFSPIVVVVESMLGVLWTMITIINFEVFLGQFWGSSAPF